MSTNGPEVPVPERSRPHELRQIVVPDGPDPHLVNETEPGAEPRTSGFLHKWLP